MAAERMPSEHRLRQRARQMAAALYAHAIWRTGDMSTVADEVHRNILSEMYEREISVTSAASWLKRSTRWLHKLASRPPKRGTDAVEDHDLHLMQVLRDQPDRWFRVTDLTRALAARGIETCDAAVEDMLRPLVDVGQIARQQAGRSCTYRALKTWRVTEAHGVEQREEHVGRQITAVPELIEQYLGGVPGSAFGILRYSIRRGEEEALAADLRQAVSGVLREYAARATADAEATPDGDRTTQVTYLVMGGQGLLGGPLVGEEV